AVAMAAGATGTDPRDGSRRRARRLFHPRQNNAAAGRACVSAEQRHGAEDEVPAMHSSCDVSLYINRRPPQLAARIGEPPKLNSLDASVSDAEVELMLSVTSPLDSRIPQNGENRPVRPEHRIASEPAVRVWPGGVTVRLLHEGLLLCAPR